MSFAFQIPCIMFHYFSETVENIKKICNILNLEITIPENQTCCGLPYFEKGEKVAAKTIAEYNLKIFGEKNILCFSNKCENTYSLYYPRIFNNTVSHNECMKMTSNVKGLPFIFEKMENINFSKLSGKYFYLPDNVLNSQIETTFIKKFTSIEWYLPVLTPTSSGSDFSLPTFNQNEAEKLALAIINEALNNNTSIIVTCNDISRQHINNMAKKTNIEITTMHLIDLIALAI